MYNYHISKPLQYFITTLKGALLHLSPVDHIKCITHREVVMILFYTHAWINMLPVSGPTYNIKQWAQVLGVRWYVILCQCVLPSYDATQWCIFLWGAGGKHCFLWIESLSNLWLQYRLQFLSLSGLVKSEESLWLLMCIAKPLGYTHTIYK